MSERICVTYHDVEVEYLERYDKWHFTLRGRERKADTLAKAKEAIDKPDPKEKTFTPVKVYIRQGYGRNDSKFAEATVTSIASSTDYKGDPEVWITIDDTRKKVSASSLFEIGTENDLTLAVIDGINTQIFELDDKLTAELAKLKRFKVAN